MDHPAVTPQIEQKEQMQPCPACHGSDLVTLFTGYDRMYGHAGSFPVCRCNSCGLVFLGHKLSLETLAGYYPTTYYSFQDQGGAAKPHSALKAWELRLRRRTEETALALFLGYPLTPSTNPIIRLNARLKKTKYEQYPHYIGSGRLLDVGCGGGAYLLKMRELGWQVAGVEPGHSGVEACHHHGLDVTEGVLEQAALADASFDFIRFEHVLEHVPDPVATLKEARRILKPGGRIRLLVPNWDSLPAQWFGTYWYHLDTPRHLFWFTPETLRDVAQRAGLHVAAMHVSVDYSDFADSLTYWLNDHLPALGRRMAKRKTLWKLCNKFALPLRLWMKRSGKGTLLDVVLVDAEADSSRNTARSAKEE